MYRFMEVEEKGGGKKIVFTLQRLDWSSDVRTDKS